MPSSFIRKAEIILFAKDLASSAFESLAKAIRRTKDESGQAQKTNDKFADSLDDTAESSSRLGDAITRAKSQIAAFAATFASFSFIKSSIQAILREGARFETLELQIKNLYSTAEEGEQAFDWVKEFARKNPTFDVTQAFVKLKAFGIEPTTGSLQALVDQTARLGGNQQTLEGIILAVGQAWAKQKLQGEEILQLVERGVPVWDLLAKATGKNVQELQELSEKGKLGRTEISLLLKEIGKSSEGAAAAQLTTFNGLIASLRNQWIRFLDTIAKSGVLDVFKKQITDLNNRIAQLAKSGELQRFAQQISDVIAGATKIVRGFVDVIASFGGSVATLLKVAVAVKAVQFAFGGLFSVIGAIFKIGLAVKLVSWVKSLGGLSAAASGASAATGVLGKAVSFVGQKLGLTSLAFSKLSTLLKGSLFVAAAAAVVEIVKLGAALVDAAKASIRFSETQKDVADNNKLLADKAQEAKNRLVEYRNEVILTQSRLNDLSEQEIQGYKQRLKAAQEYFIALRVEARSLGDDDGFKAATDKVNSYEAGLQNVETRLKQIRKEAAAAAAAQAKELAGLEANLDVLGLSLRQVQTGISDSEQEIIDAVDNISRSTQLTGDVIAKAFAEAFQQVESPQALERLKEIFDRVESDVIIVKGETKGLKEAEKAYIDVLIKRGQVLNKINEDQSKSNLESIKTINGITAAFDGSVESQQKVFAALQDSNSELSNQKNNVKDVADDTQQLKENVEATVPGWENLTEKQRKALVIQSELNAASDFYNKLLGNIEAQLTPLGDRAIEVFRNSFAGSVDTARQSVASLNERLQESTREFFTLLAQENSGAAGVFTQIASQFGRLAAEIEIAALRQQAALENIVSSAQQGNQAAAAQLQSLGTDLEDLKRRFDLVDDATLQGVINQVRQLNSEIDQSADKVTSLRERLASLRGDEIAAQELRNKREVLELEKELQAARERGNREEIRNLEEALRLQKQINKEELSQLKQREEDDRRGREPPSRTPRKPRSPLQPRQPELLPAVTPTTPAAPIDFTQPVMDIGNEIGGKLDRFVDRLEQRDREQRSRSGGLGGGQPIVVPIRDQDVKRAVFSGDFYTRFVEPEMQRRGRLRA